MIKTQWPRIQSSIVQSSITRSAIRQGSKIGLIWVSLLIVSCAHYYAIDSNLSDRVQQWNKKEAFGKSISTLELVHKKNENYANLQILLIETKSLALNYEKQLLAKASTLIQENHWHQALLLYNTGISNIPNNDEFKHAKNEFYKNRQDQIDALQLKLLFVEGQSLPDRTPLINEIAKIDPENQDAQLDALNIARQTENTTSTLLKLGKMALKNQDNEQALKYLTLAHHISPNKESTSALKKIDDRLNNIAKKKQRSNAKKQKNRIQVLLAQHKNLFEKKRFAEAKKTLLDLQSYGEKTPHIRQLEIELEQAIDMEIQFSIELGQRHYSQGQFKEAYQTWRESLNLSPNDAVLLAHIERVQRVLESLRRLNNSGQTLEFPAE
ncbi:MAG: hypothetical protein KUG82_12190 [Pseudomonadales bacterium]|nr:hypothetical protein [Pseudomonadales bacterium]